MESGWSSDGNRATNSATSNFNKIPFASTWNSPSSLSLTRSQWTALDENFVRHKRFVHACLLLQITLKYTDKFAIGIGER